MAEAPKAPVRPWTPTERPGDASYTSPVVFHGDHRVADEGIDSGSETSWEEESLPRSALPPVGKEPRSIDAAASSPQPARFRSSYALRDDAAASAPEVPTYQPYRQPQATGASRGVSQRNSQALNVERGDRLPPNNPYRLSLASEAPSKDDVSTSGTQASSNTPKREHDDTRLPSNNPYRLSQAMNSESTEGLLVRPQRISQAFSLGSTDGSSTKPQRLSQAPRTESADSIATITTQSAFPTAHPAPPASRPTFQSQLAPQAPAIALGADDNLPSITGTSTRSISILLINPNSTKSMTTRCLESIASTVPPNVIVYGFTAPRPAPTAIESQLDAIMSTAACVRAILPIASKYDAFLVACFSHHPLIAALREQVTQPVIGIMEASLYASRMCGGTLGIVTTGVRSSLLHDASVKNVYGLDAFSVGTESSRLSVLELESRDPREVQERIAFAARRLQAKGADCICLGCAGMTDLQNVCQDAVGMHDRLAMVIDGVAMGVHFLVGLVRENLGTAKGGGYTTASRHKEMRQQR